MSTIELELSPDRPSDWPLEGGMKFRLIDTLIGTLDLACERGYVVKSYDFAHPNVRTVSTPNSLDDGTFDLTKFVGERAVSLEITLKARASVNDTGPLIAPESRLRDRLRGFLHPSRRPRLVFSEYQDPLVRQILLRGSDSSASFSLPRYNAMSVAWVAPRAYIESYRVKTAHAFIDDVLPGPLTLNITNEGNAPAYWAAKISGETNGPIFTLNNAVLGTQTLQLDYATHAVGDIVEIDSFSHTVLINGSPVGYRYISDQSEWFRIPPGTSELSIGFDEIRPGYPFGVWTAGQNGPPFTPPADTGMWWDDGLAPPAVGVPPEYASPHAWSARPGPGGDPALAEVQFSWTDTWL